MLCDSREGYDPLEAHIDGGLTHDPAPSERHQAGRRARRRHRPRVVGLAAPGPVGEGRGALAPSGGVQDHHAGRQGDRTDPWLKGNPKTPADYKDLAKLGKVDLI